jgi:hypothetical protein
MSRNSPNRMMMLIHTVAWPRVAKSPRPLQTRPVYSNHDNQRSSSAFLAAARNTVQCQPEPTGFCVTVVAQWLQASGRTWPPTYPSQMTLGSGWSSNNGHCLVLREVHQTVVGPGVFGHPVVKAAPPLVLPAVFYVRVLWVVCRQVL